jgi:hypothetical protein
MSHAVDALSAQLLEDRMQAFRHDFIDAMIAKMKRIFAIVVVGP